MNDSGECVDFSVFIITKGDGSINLSLDADLDDLANSWSDVSG